MTPKLKIKNRIEMKAILKENVNPIINEKKNPCESHVCKRQFGS
jgi:hypothetical protein